MESKEALAKRRSASQRNIQAALSSLMLIPDAATSPQVPSGLGGMADASRYPVSGPQTAPQSATEAVFNTALQKLIAASGGKIKVGSGKRTRAQQEKLYKEKPHLAAKPGHSKHEIGIAADLIFADDAARAFAHANAAQFGLKFPMLTRAPGKKYEPWHVEL